MPKAAALCNPATLTELEPICAEILDELLASPSRYYYPVKPDLLSNEVIRRVRVLATEDGLDHIQIKRAILNSFRVQQ